MIFSQCLGVAIKSEEWFRDQSIFSHMVDPHCFKGESFLLYLFFEAREALKSDFLWFARESWRHGPRKRERSLPWIFRGAFWPLVADQDSAGCRLIGVLPDVSSALPIVDHILRKEIGDVDWLKDARQCRMRHQQSNHVNGNFFHSTTAHSDSHCWSVLLELDLGCLNSDWRHTHIHNVSTCYLWPFLTHSLWKRAWSLHVSACFKPTMYICNQNRAGVRMHSSNWRCWGKRGQESFKSQIQNCMQSL